MRLEVHADGEDVSDEAVGSSRVGSSLVDEDVRQIKLINPHSPS